MKKIYAQKKLFVFLNFVSVFFLIIGLYGGITADQSMFYILFVSLGLSLLSLLFLVNRIYYNDSEIMFVFIYRKVTVSYNQIKEIFVRRDYIYGTAVIFNLEKETKEECFDYLGYTRITKKNGIKNIIYMIGISIKDFENIIKHCNCKIKGND